jgi:hypothetical protein
MSETSKILNLELKKCALAPIECSFENVVKYIKTCCTSDASIASRVQMKSWAGKALETVNCCAFLERRLIGAC